jgi:hypothetical protein
MRNQALKIIFLIIFSGITNLHSQTVEDISTDRPDRTEAPDIMKTGFFQTETGFFFEKTKNEFGLEISEFSFPDILLRYGLSEKIEIRMHTEFINQNSSVSDNYRGLLPLEIGTKINLTEGKQLIPKTSFILETEIPGTAGKNKNIKHLSPSISFLFKNSISENVDVSYNTGIKWNVDEKTNMGFYTLSFGVSPFSKTTFFIETFGFFAKDLSPDIRVDYGISFLLAKNSLIDVSSGFGLTGSVTGFFLGFGYSIRLPE